MREPIGRRVFLRSAGVGVTAAALSCTAIRSIADPPPLVPSPLLFHSPPMRPYVDELPRLPVLRGDRLDLVAAATTHRFHSDFDAVPALGYGGASYLGPTIEHRVDEPLTVRFANNLGPHPFAADLDTTMGGVRDSYRTAPPCSLHLHGGVTPPDSDGHPERLVFPGHSATHHFPLRQHATQLWYHDHAMGLTRANVYAGLAGSVLLRDEFDTGEPGNPLGLPAGEFEVPLVLQEKLFGVDGQQSMRSTIVVPQGSWEGGAVGDVGLVNGAVWPECRVARGLYRFRVLNAASFSVWNLFFDNHMRFWVIGNDHGLLDAPVEVRNLKLSPGERVDLLVDFSRLAPGDTVELCNDEPPVFQAAILGEIAMPRFCRFRAGSAGGFTGPIPDRLRGGPGRPDPLPPLATPTVVRTVTVSQPYELRDPPAMMTLNNLTFDDPEIELPRQGTVEQWDIVNITPDPHPIHVHLVDFRILGRTALRTLDYQVANPQPPVGTKWTPSAEGFLAGPQVPPADWEAGRKDIVRVDGGTVTRIIVRFPTADELGFDPDATFSRLPDKGMDEIDGGAEEFDADSGDTAEPGTDGIPGDGSMSTRMPGGADDDRREMPSSATAADGHGMRGDARMSDGMPGGAGVDRREMPSSATAADSHGMPGDAPMAGGMSGDPAMSGEMATGDLQGYIWHCHILDHEDHEMMLRYRLVAE